MKPTPSRLRWIAATLLIAGSGVAGYLVATAVRPAPTPALVLRGLDLGELREGESTVRKLTLVNQSAEVVRVTRLSGDCRCTTFRPEVLTIPVGGRATVEVEIKLDRTEVARSETELSVLADAVGLTSGRNLSAEWSMAGRIVRDVFLNEDDLDFGELTAERAAMSAQTLRVRTKLPVTGITARFDKSLFRAEASSSAGGWGVVVRPAAPLADGAIGDTLRLAVGCEGRTEPVQFTVPVHLYVLPAVEVVPERLLGGRREVGTTEREEVLLTARSGARLTVMELAKDEKGLRVAKVHDDSGSGLRITVEYSVVKEGFDERRVRIDVKQAGGDEVFRVIVPVQVSGHRPTNQEAKP